MPNIAYTALTSDLVVYVGRDAPMDDADCQAYVRWIDELVPRVKASGGVLKFFVVVDDSSPQAKHRAAIAKATQNVETRTAVVTSSTLAQFVITAFGWLNVAAKGFAPTNVVAAGKYLDLTPELLSSAVSAALELAPRVAGCRALDVANDVLRRAANG
jgi:hypothetical protein